jgi:hypothetical protein
LSINLRLTPGFGCLEEYRYVVLSKFAGPNKGFAQHRFRGKRGQGRKNAKGTLKPPNGGGTHTVLLCAVIFLARLPWTANGYFHKIITSFQPARDNN